jgi:hypothetical protein
MSLRWCESPDNGARIAALSADHAPTAIIGCPHMDFRRIVRIAMASAGGLGHPPAQDGFLPPAFATRGRHLVFSYGIIVLSVLSTFLLIVFGGVTEKLIPLFAVGAFSAFLFSPTGMVMHWLRKGTQATRLNLVYNGLGAVTTGIVLIIIILAKFAQGAWLVVVVAPALVFLLHKINRHYKRIRREVEEPLKLVPSKLKPPVVIVPIDGWDRVTEKAVRIGALLSKDIIALHICTERDDKRRLRKLWAERVDLPAKTVNLAVPRLEIIDSPYRRIYQPILDFISRTKQVNPDRLVASLALHIR